MNIALLKPGVMLCMAVVLVSACGGGGGSNDGTSADAGIDLSVTEGSVVQLVGTGNSAQGAISFAWSQTAGPNVALIGSSLATASFIAPQVNGPTLLSFTLTATDGGGNSATDSIQVTVNETSAVGFSVGGSISGNTAGVTLALNGVAQTFPGPDFAFGRSVAGGSVYAVTFVATPSNQVCTIGNGGGVIGANVTNVTVNCSDPVSVLRYPDVEVVGYMAQGDFNGDTTLDLAFTIRTLPGHPVGANNSMIRFAFGDGSGSFPSFFDAPTLDHATTPKRGHIAIATDINNDPIDDLAISSGRALQVLAGNGARAPAVLVNSPEPSGAPLYGIDVDGNGFEDFVSVIRGGSIQNFFNLYRNNGDGSLGAVEFIGSSLDAAAVLLSLGQPLNFVIGDFDGDTIDDILANMVVGGANAGLALVLFSGNGDGTFEYPAATDGLSSELFLGTFAFEESSREIAFGDFDGDNDLDLAITSTTSFLQIMLNNGTGRFSAGQRVVVGIEPIHVRAVDFDNDNLLDLLSINHASRNAIISYGSGDGRFGDNSGAADSWEAIQLDTEVDLRDVQVADFNGDGFADVVVSEDGTNPPNSGRGSVQILLSPGQ